VTYYILSFDVVLNGLTNCDSSEKVKGKERKSIYIAPSILRIVSKHSDMDHTVLPANCTMSAFAS